MKKKFFALMMAMVMVLSLAACGGSDEADSNSGDSAGGESSGSSAFKVGVIGPLTGGAAIYAPAWPIPPRSRWTKSMPWAATSSLS